MVNTKVVINGNELIATYISSQEVSVYGKLKAGIFFRGECTDILYFVSALEPSVDTVLFVGQNLRFVYKSSTAVVISGDVERVVLVNRRGNAVKTYKVNECGSENPFEVVS